MSQTRHPSMRRRLEQFHQRWNIQVDQSRELERFKNRVLTAVDRTVGVFLLDHPLIADQFAFSLGHRQPTISATGWPVLARALASNYALSEKKFTESPVYSGLASALNQREMVLALQTLFWVLTDARCRKVAALAAAIRSAIDASPFIDIQLAVRGKTVSLYPRGAKLLDQGAVNDTLAWLDGHKSAATHFGNALRIYLTKNESSYRALLDDLRSSVEKLVQDLLGNRKSLENQKTLLLGWMEERGVHVQVRNMLHKLLEHFAQYQNNAVKHGEGWSPKEVEFLIYLTGTFMRLLLQVEGKS
ncbi:MAG: hypothetical protein KAT11_01535 [Phycisphaerae bacterium]|nr:hypothetical protein [Phycisphaerae bacterium]